MSAYYPHDTSFFSKRLIVFVAIIALHLLIIWAFVTGLATSGARYVVTILQTNLIQTEKQKQLPPPPPPDQLKAHPPVQVIAPDININLPSEAPPITYVPRPKPIVVRVAPPSPIVMARPTYAPDPADYYPDQSRRNNEEGRALVHICIDTRGKVASAEIQTSAGHPLLDEAAVKLSKAYRFKPATQGGRPVPVCTALPVKFVLTAGQ